MSKTNKGSLSIMNISYTKYDDYIRTLPSEKI